MDTMHCSQIKSQKVTVILLHLRISILCDFDVVGISQPGVDVIRTSDQIIEESSASWTQPNNISQQTYIYIWKKIKNCDIQ